MFFASYRHPTVQTEISRRVRLPTALLRNRELQRCRETKCSVLVLGVAANVNRDHHLRSHTRRKRWHFAVAAEIRERERWECPVLLGTLRSPDAKALQGGQSEGRHGQHIGLFRTEALLHPEEASYVVDRCGSSIMLRNAGEDRRAPCDHNRTNPIRTLHGNRPIPIMNRACESDITPGASLSSRRRRHIRSSPCDSVRLLGVRADRNGVLPLSIAISNAKGQSNWSRRGRVVNRLVIATEDSLRTAMKPILRISQQGSGHRSTASTMACHRQPRSDGVVTSISQRSPPTSVWGTNQHSRQAHALWLEQRGLRPTPKHVRKHVEDVSSRVLAIPHECRPGVMVFWRRARCGVFQAPDMVTEYHWNRSQHGSYEGYGLLSRRLEEQSPGSQCLSFHKRFGNI